MKTTLAVMLFGGALAMSACAPVEGSNSDPLPPGDGSSQCMADRHQDWIGKHRSVLPQPPAGARWRVTCTSCPMTMDYNPNRLNILYDQASGIIREVRCG